jgi:hypothetical protein
MQKIIPAITAVLRRMASLKVIGLIFLLALIGRTFISGEPFGVAQLEKMTNGVGIPDAEMSYSPQRAYDILTAQGEAGRSFYLHTIVPQDFPFPFLYALFFAAALTYLAQRLLPPEHPLQHIGLLGLLAGLSDWAENLCLLAVLLNYPQRLDAVATLAGIFTVIKWSLALVNAILIVGGLGWLLVKAIMAANAERVVGAKQ